MRMSGCLTARQPYYVYDCGQLQANFKGIVVVRLDGVSYSVVATTVVPLTSAANWERVKCLVCRALG